MDLDAVRCSGEFAIVAGERSYWLFAVVEKIAPMGTTVILEGETGTCKDE
jgi:hypothetical protein